MDGLLAGQQHLDGDNPVQAELAGLEHDAHAAAGDFFEQLMVAKPLLAAGFFFVGRPLGLGQVVGQTGFEQATGATFPQRTAG